ncbi:MAG: Fe-S cluster assembly ATPase SufC [Candidatus Aenigmarchaeota archaeon]|nr:Fe-S cluster assembly ATPase SufC [Candidatus Aenigmarchaeota archaeon]
MPLLKIKNLSVAAENKKIIDDVTLNIKEGEIVAIMGPNGSGKTTLARSIINDPRLNKQGKIYFKEKDITNLSTDEIARLGIFLSFQSPPEIESVKTGMLLTYIKDNFDEEEVKKSGIKLGLPEDFLERGLNVGLSGGEKKKMEILLMKLLDPELIILDEIDSGLDIDSLTKINDIIKEMNDKGKTFLIITHYTRIFQKIKPDRVLIMKNGKIVKRSDSSLLKVIDENGYDGV